MVSGKWFGFIIVYSINLLMYFEITVGKDYRTNNFFVSDILNKLQKKYICHSIYQVPDSESAFDAATAVVAGSSPTALWSSVVQGAAQALRHHRHPHSYQHRSVGVDHLPGSHL